MAAKAQGLPPEDRIKFRTDDNKFLCASVKKARQEAGLTQAELAEKIGTKQPSVARMERGQNSPTIGYLTKVADALGKELRVELQ